MGTVTRNEKNKSQNGILSNVKYWRPSRHHFEPVQRSIAQIFERSKFLLIIFLVCLYFPPWAKCLKKFAAVGEGGMDMTRPSNNCLKATSRIDFAHIEIMLRLAGPCFRVGVEEVGGSHCMQ